MHISGSFWVSAALLLTNLSFGTAIRSESTPARTCLTEVYRGFDSRLALSIAGQFPVSAEEPVGFAALNGSVLVAYAHRALVSQEGSDIAALPSFKQIRYLLSSNSDARLVTPDGLLRFGDHGLEAVSVEGFNKDAEVAQDATDNALLAVQHGTRAEFSAWKAEGVKVPLFAISGKLGRISWTSAGFAAIVDDSLFTLDTGATRIESTPTDINFREATDLCMVGPSRAVVMFPNTAVLYAHGLRTILGVIHKGKCSWNKQSLYLLDLASGIAWRVEDLNDVGDPGTTKLFLQHLTEQAKTKNDAGDRAYRELARFVGVDKASNATGRSNPCPPLDPPHASPLKSRATP